MDTRLDDGSLDIEKMEMEKLKKVFPQCFVEGKIDIRKLLSLCGVYVDNDFERYKFEWKGKSESLRLAQSRSMGTLRPAPERSVDWNTTQNLYIEGDNLEVLKLLQTAYNRRVKLIYIDPPYNTGKDFVYKDDFVDSIYKYKEITSQTTKGNPETMGRYHTNWLNMMYPRLMLASNLLTEDGVIFISIDDKEVHNLRKVCDEVFGEENFVGLMIWHTSTENNPRQISTEHEYILCYAKRLDCQNKWVIKSSKADRISRKYLELKNKYYSDIPRIRTELKKWIKQNEKDLKGVSHYTYVDDNGVYYPGNSSNTKPGGYNFDIIHPITNRICRKPDFGYRWPKTTFDRAAKKGDVEWGKEENTIPKIKKRIDSVTEILKSYYYEDNRYWTKYLTELFGNKRIFENPKSLNLLLRILKFTTSGNDIVLDFFSGSGTTAHAVMQLNKEDGGNRKFVMVQLPELTDVKSEAFKAGYRNICEIGEERIRRAGAKIKAQCEAKQAKKSENLFADQEERLKPLDTGFKVFRLDTSNLKTWDNASVDNEQSERIEGLLDRMNDMVDTIKNERTDEDVIYEIMLKMGFAPTFSVTPFEVKGKRAYCIEEDCLMIVSLAEGLTTEIIERMAEEYLPSKMMFSEKCFADATEIAKVHYLLKDRVIELKLV